MILFWLRVPVDFSVTFTSDSHTVIHAIQHCVQPTSESYRSLMSYYVGPTGIYLKMMGINFSKFRFYCGVGPTG